MMIRILTVAAAITMLAGSPVFAQTGGQSLSHQVDGLITKPSSYPADVTLDRLEAALKERGFVIFARLDHAAAAASVGLKMPRETVLVFGNPRLGTPNFLKYPTLAIDLPLKALVWEDAAGKVWLSYNSQKFLYESAYARHGPQGDAVLFNQVETALASLTDAATK